MSICSLDHVTKTDTYSANKFSNNSNTVAAGTPTFYTPSSHNLTVHYWILNCCSITSVFIEFYNLYQNLTIHLKWAIKLDNITFFFYRSPFTVVSMMELKDSLKYRYILQKQITGAIARTLQEFYKIASHVNRNRCQRKTCKTRAIRWGHSLCVKNSMYSPWKIISHPDSTHCFADMDLVGSIFSCD